MQAWIGIIIINPKEKDLEGGVNGDELAIIM